MELVQPGIGLIFWMALVFGLLLFVLGKYAWKPIMKGLRDRESSIEKSIKAAEIARDEMKKLKFDNEQLLKEAKNERDEILREGRKVRDTIIDEAKLKATEEADRIVENAKERIEYEKLAAMTDLKNQIAEISIEIAEKILKEELSDDRKQRDYVEKLIDKTKLN
jgi:F-type H+-transporting ATPase subunit b